LGPVEMPVVTIAVVVPVIGACWTVSRSTTERL
jgi:hypothetical protein